MPSEEIGKWLRVGEQDEGSPVNKTGCQHMTVPNWKRKSEEGSNAHRTVVAEGQTEVKLASSVACAQQKRHAEETKIWETEAERGCDFKRWR
jgi:hypothetical protein